MEKEERIVIDKNCDSQTSNSVNNKEKKNGKENDRPESPKEQKDKYDSVKIEDLLNSQFDFKFKFAEKCPEQQQKSNHEEKLDKKQENNKENLNVTENSNNSTFKSQMRVEVKEENLKNTNIKSMDPAPTPSKPATRNFQKDAINEKLIKETEESSPKKTDINYSDLNCEQCGTQFGNSLDYKLHRKVCYSTDEMLEDVIR